MHAKKLRCHCGGHPDCKLCHGSGKYLFQPGDDGYMPFACPTCEGARTVLTPQGVSEPCKTCKGAGMVDPGNPATGGLADVLTKILFGA